MASESNLKSFKIGLLAASCALVVLPLFLANQKDIDPLFKLITSAGASFGGVYLGFAISDFFSESLKKQVSDMISSAVEKISTKGRAELPSKMPPNIYLYYVSRDKNHERYWQLAVIDVESKMDFDSWIGSTALKNDSGTEIEYKSDIYNMKHATIIAQTAQDQSSNERTAINIMCHTMPGGDGFGVLIHDNWKSELSIDPLMTFHKPFRPDRDLLGKWPTTTKKILEPRMIAVLDDHFSKHRSHVGRLDHLLSAKGHAENC